MIINFICGERKYRYEVHFTNETVSYELLQAHPFGEMRAHKVYERTLDNETMVSDIKWGEKYRSASNARDLIVNLLPNRTVFGSFQMSNIDIPVMKSIVDWAQSYLLPIVKNSEQHLADYTSEQLYEKKIDSRQVRNLLRAADIGVSDFKLSKEERSLPPKLIDMILKDDNAPDDLKSKLKECPTIEDINIKMLHNGVDGEVAFDFSEESNGTQRYYELSSILLKLINESHFVSIDELDCKMHPDLYQHFIDTYLSNSSQSQLIFTTHMREFLNDKDRYRDDAVWFTEKDNTGATNLYSLADFGSDILRKSTNRYNADRTRMLGAIPRLGETYIDTSTSSTGHE